MYSLVQLKSTIGLKLRLSVVLFKYVGATHAVALYQFQDWSFHVFRLFQLVVVLVHISDLSHIWRFDDAQPGEGWITGGASVSKFIAKNPNVQAWVLSFQPPSHHSNGVLFTQSVEPGQGVVNIPAGLNHIANVSVDHWFHLE